MSNEKLQSVAMLAIENERTQLLDNEKVIDAFAASHKNRRTVLRCKRSSSQKLKILLKAHPYCVLLA